MIAETSVTVYRGETRDLTFIATGEDVLTWNTALTVAPATNAPTKLLSVEGVPDDDGVLVFSVSADDTDLPPGKYVYDVWRTDEGDETLLFIGAFNVRGNARVPVEEA